MNFKKFLPHLASIVIFIIAAVLYFHPVLNGQKMSQSDITQHIGMAKDVNDFRAKTGEEPYWSDAFSGMPTYQIGTYFPNDYIKALDDFIRFLPRPADYLFLYFLGFYVLMLALKVDWKLSILGALTFGFSTYMIIIFGAGHNAKAHTIAYMPAILAGILWVFQRKYLLGFVVTALAAALQIKANHPQMTYYLLFAILFLGIFELSDAIKKKEFPAFIKQTLVLFGAMMIAVGINSTRLMATKQYADYSTRGKSELTIQPDGKKKESTSGLSKEYITQYSYGIDETFNLIVPRYMGGGTVEPLGEDSYTYEFVENIAGPQQAAGFTQNIYTYWGQQPFIEAPAYIGAVIFFFFFLGAFLVRGKLKYWLISATVFSIVMSWGKNIFLTDLFIDFVPLYNKFRAVSSFQVIAELCVPILGILGIKEIFSKDRTEFEKTKGLKMALYTTAGVVVAGLLYAYGFSTFEGIRDGSYAQYEGLIDAVIADRKSLLFSDSFRSLVLIGLSFGILWLYLKNKLKQTIAIGAFAVLILFDQLQVNLRYVNADDFKSARRIDKPFVASPVDKEILKDQSYYRVANFTGNPFEEGRTSYFHNSIGGYHAAKMGRYSDVIDFYMNVYEGKISPEVLNMLNTKYLIVPTDEGSQQVQVNPEVNGSVWFVSKVSALDSADEEIQRLGTLKTKEEAIIRFDDAQFENAQSTGNAVLQFEQDSTATIKLVDYKLNHLTYESKTTKDQFAVFSEIYYKDGWNAYIDGELTPYFQTNYILRGLKVPAGEHTIEFKFEPKVIQTGSTISLVSYALLFLIPIGWFFVERRKKDSEPTQ